MKWTRSIAVVLALGAILNATLGFGDESPEEASAVRYVRQMDDPLAVGRLRPIDQVNTDITIQTTGEVPLFAPPYLISDELDGAAASLDRGWAHTTCTWEAMGLSNRPLYYQDIALERYGHSICPLLQPALSGAHFFGTLPILPYLMTLHRPFEQIYTIGYYRPGSVAPKRMYRPPLRLDAAAVEAAAVTGVIFVVP